MSGWLPRLSQPHRDVDDEVIERPSMRRWRVIDVKWMRLSGPKLRDRIDLWVAKFDPAGVRIPPKVKDNRYVDIGETSPGMAGIWASVLATDDGGIRQAARCVGGHGV